MGAYHFDRKQGRGHRAIGPISTRAAPGAGSSAADGALRDASSPIDAFGTMAWPRVLRRQPVPCDV